VSTASHETGQHDVLDAGAAELLVAHFLPRLVAPLRACFPALAVELVACSTNLDLRRRLGILPCVVAAANPALRRLSGPTPVLSREIWLVASRELRAVPRVRAVADWLAERLAQEAAVLGGR